MPQFRTAISAVLSLVDIHVAPSMFDSDHLTTIEDGHPRMVMSPNDRLIIELVRECPEGWKMEKQTFSSRLVNPAKSTGHKPPGRQIHSARVEQGRRKAVRVAQIAEDLMLATPARDGVATADSNPIEDVIQIEVTGNRAVNCELPCEIQHFELLPEATGNRLRYSTQCFLCDCIAAFVAAGPPCS